jgi:uncharacterized protein YegJ (DUF2314 family)
MNPKAQSPALDLPWIAVPLALVGGFLLWEGLDKSVPYSALHGTIILAVGIAVWFQQAWARIIGAAYFALIACAKLYEQSSTEFTLPQMLAVGGCASLGWAVWCWRESPRKGAARPLVSLVLLLRQARFLSDRAIARAAATAWGGEFLSGDVRERGNVVSGESPLFMIHAGTASYLVHNQDQTYFDGRENEITAIKDLSLRQVVIEHRAWIAVDLLESGREFKSAAQAYPKISRLLAELSGPDCVAVLCPETGFICAYDENIDEKLRSADPLKTLKATEAPPPPPITDDDPRIAVAVAEARRRWPEFLEAFNKQQPGQIFSIRAVVPLKTAGQTESIWVRVSQIDDQVIRGNVDSDPRNLDLKSGASVVVELKNLTDWAFTQGEKTTGLFTLKALQEPPTSSTPSVGK